MVGNITSPQKFLMFPGFVQLLMNAQAADLPMTGQTMKITPMQKRIFADCRQYGKYVTPPTTPLFGHITDPNYVAPDDDAWVDPP